mmetsp:Transcript_37897/g.90696  ORF Transcript_37897/g.90696 Transcript_37897/m.90696 type:complete len:205 (+) Transcript_37897:218-832(+)
MSSRKSRSIAPSSISSAGYFSMSVACWRRKQSGANWPVSSFSSPKASTSSMTLAMASLAGVLYSAFLAFMKNWYRSWTVGRTRSGGTTSCARDASSQSRRPPGDRRESWTIARTDIPTAGWLSCDMPCRAAGPISRRSSPAGTPPWWSDRTRRARAALRSICSAAVSPPPPASRGEARSGARDRSQQSSSVARRGVIVGGVGGS